MTTFERLQDHYNESLERFPEDRIVGIFLQGSHNYRLDIPTSDVDTKLILVPTFKDIAMNRQPISTTHIRANEEHIDEKDIRLYMQTFRKQNLNFLEILFTNYKIINPLYENEWNRLIAAREKIARMNPYRAVKSMYGIAMEKYHAMCHPYPSKLAILEKYGYDPKQLHHLLRVEEYLRRYIKGEEYEKCLISNYPDRLIDVKCGKYNLDEALNIADLVKIRIEAMTANFCAKTPETEDPNIRLLLEDVQYNIMKIAIMEELKHT